MTTTSWAVRYEGYDPAEEGLREALCVLGNGYLATRGAAPESRVGSDVHYPGTYVAGVFNRLSEEMSGRVVDNESIVNLPNWLSLTFRIDGGAWFDVDDVELLEYVQELDLREAVLTRRLRYRDAEGRTTAVAQRRLVSMHDPHVAVLETTIHAEDWAGRLEIRSGIESATRNWLVPRYRELRHEHHDVVEAGHPHEDVALVEVETNESHVRVAVGVRTRLHKGDAPVEPERRQVAEDGWVGHELAVGLARGESVTAEKVAAVYTSRDHAIEAPDLQVVRELPRLGGLAELREAHRIAWRHLWERFHFDLNGAHHDHDGQAETLQILRLHLLHLVQTLSPHTAELDVGVPARGLHGEAYRGHIFWDEIFVLPVLNLRMPEVTRSLLLYRHRRLPEARYAAQHEGYAGAMFPWQSGSDGREETQQLHLNPMSGHWNPDPTHRQRHVGIAVAYNVWQYYEASDDVEFMAAYGAEMLLEIARFWASIAEYDVISDRYVIRGVMGPDEFHTGYPGGPETGLDNNAYTNVMAVYVLLRAIDTLELLPELTRRELLETLGIGPADLERWQEITRKMYVPFHGDGIISQFEGYGDLEELDWERCRLQYGDIQRLDRILEAEGDNPNRYKLSKQADVLMLFYLLSEEEVQALFDRLGYELTADAISRTIEYYEARSSHGSTLSAVVHSWAMARNHPERSLEFYQRALLADVADIQGGTTREGIHLAAMTGTIDLLQRCFTGLELRGEHLRFNPAWHPSLGEVSFAIQYRGLPLEITVSSTRLRVCAGPGVEGEIVVECGGKTARLRPGATAEFLCPPSRQALTGATARRPMAAAALE